MATYVFADGGLINKETGVFEPFDRNAPVKLPRISTSDEQEATLSMADGKMYTSKAAMRESYKATHNPQGVNYVEVGNDQSYRQTATAVRKPDAQKITDAVDRAYADLQAGRFND